MASLISLADYKDRNPAKCSFASMEFPFRQLILHEWPEDFDMAANLGFLVQLIEDAGVNPTKAQFATGRQTNGDLIWRRRTIFKKYTPIDIISEFSAYSICHLYKPVLKSSWDLETSITFESDSWQWRGANSETRTTKTYQIGKRPCRLSMQQLVRHLQLFCTRMTPRYGYSHVMDGSTEISFYQHGGGVTGMTANDRMRASELGERENREKHLSGLLHDVYEFNVLSPAHLARRVGKTCLADWIASGQLGTLAVINDAVSAWYVPKQVRSLARLQLMDAGLLTTQVK